MFLSGQALSTHEDVTSVFSNIEKKYLNTDDNVSLDEIAAGILPE